MPIAVIIDLTESRIVKVKDRRKLDEELRSALQTVYKRYKKHCIAKPTLTQGDSLELLVNNWMPAIYLFHKLLLKELEFRVGLGASTIHLLRESADECDGPAFWNARGALDEIRSMKRKKVIANFRAEDSTPKEEIAHIATSILYLINLRSLTTQQLRYCYYYMWEGKNITQIAKITRRSKSNISKNLAKTQCYTIMRLVNLLEQRENLGSSSRKG